MSSVEQQQGGGSGTSTEEFRFAVHGTPKELHLSASSEMERAGWISALANALVPADPKVLPISQGAAAGEVPRLQSEPLGSDVSPAAAPAKAELLAAAQAATVSALSQLSDARSITRAAATASATTLGRERATHAAAIDAAEESHGKKLLTKQREAAATETRRV